MVAVPAGGRETEALREEVGVVVVADVAGLLPWAMEDTINTRSVPNFKRRWRCWRVPWAFWTLKCERRGWEEGERADDRSSTR